MFEKIVEAERIWDQTEMWIYIKKERSPGTIKGKHKSYIFLIFDHSKRSSYRKIVATMYLEFIAYMKVKWQ